MMQGRWTSVFGRVAAVCVVRSRLVVSLAVVVLIASIVLLSRMRIASSLEAMLGTGAESASAMHRATTHYRSGDALMVLVSADSAGSDAKQALLKYAELLRQRIEQGDRGVGVVAWVRLGPDPALARFAATYMLPAGAFYLDDAGLAEFSLRVRPERMNEQFARNESMMASPGPVGNALSDGVLTDPLRLLELVPASIRARGETEFSTDQRAVLLRIGGRGTPGDLDAAGTLHDLVRDALGATQGVAQASGLRVELGGGAAIATTASRTIRRDSIISTMVSVALLYLLFVVFYRRWFAAVIIGIVAAVGMMAGFAVYAIFSATVSPLAAAVSALLAGLGVDYGIHFLAHYDVRRAAGATVLVAASETAARMAMPIITNCMTSIFGFASLWASDIKMLRDFAMMGSAGLGGALVAVFVLMPALLAWFDAGKRMVDARPARFGVIADAVAIHPRRWMTSTLLVLAAILCIASVRGLVPTLEADLTKLHPQPNAALRVTNEIISRFGSQGEIIPVEVRARSSSDLLVAAHDAAKQLMTPACRDAGVEAVLGLHQLLPDPRRIDSVRATMAGIDPVLFAKDFDQAVESSVFRIEAYVGYREAVVRMLAMRDAPGIREVLMYPSVAERLFPADQLADSDSVRETILLVRLAKPLHDRAVRDKTVATLGDAVRNIPGATVAGLPAVSMELEAATRTGLPISIIISLCLVLMWLLVVFRDPIDVLLALIPLACAAAAVISYMAITRTSLNPINCVAIPLLDGIAVDAGVFLVAVARVHGRTREELTVELRPTIHAVLLAVATTITGFASMYFTTTPAIRSLGVIAAVGIAGSLAGAIGILVPLLMLRAGRRSVR